MTTHLLESYTLTVQYCNIMAGSENITFQSLGVRGGQLNLPLFILIVTIMCWLKIQVLSEDV